MALSNGRFSNGRIKLPARDRLSLMVVFIFLTSEVFSGALRYYLTQMGKPELVYVPKLLITVTYIGLLMRAAYIARFSRLMLQAITLFSFFLFIGYYHTHHLIQPLFGAFVLLPILFGMLTEPTLNRLNERLVYIAILLWVCAACGLFYDYFAGVPWAGLKYQFGDLTIEGSRSWSSFDIYRYAGFSRISNDVATQLLFFSLAWIVLGHRKNLAFISWFITGLLLVITANKTRTAVYLFLTIVLLLMENNFISGQLKRMVSIISPLMLSIIGIILPFSAYFITYDLKLDDYISKLLLSSFEDRLVRMWPQTLSLAFEYGNSLLGRGLGGVGASQLYFEPLLYSPADNLYLYLYISFGIIALILIILYTINICRLPLNKSKWIRLMFYWAISILMIGWTDNSVESQFMGFILGLTIAHAFNRENVKAPVFSSLRTSKSKILLPKNYTIPSDNR